MVLWKLVGCVDRRNFSQLLCSPFSRRHKFVGCVYRWFGSTPFSLSDQGSKRNSDIADKILELLGSSSSKGSSSKSKGTPSFREKIPSNDSNITERMRQLKQRPHSFPDDVKEPSSQDNNSQFELPAIRQSDHILSSSWLSGSRFSNESASSSKQPTLDELLSKTEVNSTPKSVVADLREATALAESFLEEESSLIVDDDLRNLKDTRPLKKIQEEENLNTSERNAGKYLKDIRKVVEKVLDSHKENDGSALELFSEEKPINEKNIDVISTSNVLSENGREKEDEYLKKLKKIYNVDEVVIEELDEFGSRISLRGDLALAELAKISESADKYEKITKAEGENLTKEECIELSIRDWMRQLRLKTEDGIGSDSEDMILPWVHGEGAEHLLQILAAGRVFELDARRFTEFWESESENREMRAGLRGYSHAENLVRRIITERYLESHRPSSNSVSAPNPVSLLGSSSLVIDPDALELEHLPFPECPPPRKRTIEQIEMSFRRKMQEVNADMIFNAFYAKRFMFQPPKQQQFIPSGSPLTSSSDDVTSSDVDPNDSVAYRNERDGYGEDLEEMDNSDSSLSSFKRDELKALIEEGIQRTRVYNDALFHELKIMYVEQQKIYDGINKNRKKFKEAMRKRWKLIMEKKKERKRRIKDRGDPIRPRINPIEEEGFGIYFPHIMKTVPRTHMCYGILMDYARVLSKNPSWPYSTKEIMMKKYINFLLNPKYPPGYEILYKDPKTLERHDDDDLLEEDQ